MVRRGFQAAAERLGAAIRAEIGLGLHDRLDPRQLADEYGVPVAPITDLIAEGASAASIRQLIAVDRGCFSAATVIAGSGRLIVFNPAHADGRLANSLTHELAHLLLEHPFGPAIGPGGCRVWDRELEAEADVLAATLLVPREAALACARAGLPHGVGAAHFGVSSDLMRWRTDHSGATRQAQAAARARGITLPRLTAADLRSVELELEWMRDLTVRQWLGVLKAWRIALATGSVNSAIAVLQPPGTRA